MESTQEKRTERVNRNSQQPLIKTTMKKIKFTSKLTNQPNARQKAGGEKRRSILYFKNEAIGTVNGEDELILYCSPENEVINFTDFSTHRELVTYIKDHAEVIYNNYNLKIKTI